MTTGLLGKTRKGTLVAYGLGPGPVRVKNPGDVPPEARPGIDHCVFSYDASSNSAEYVGLALARC